MNKPFITQAQLALYKYQPSSEYFGQSMAFIAQKEFEEFVNNVKEYDILESFSYFLNKGSHIIFGRFIFLMSLLFL